MKTLQDLVYLLQDYPISIVELDPEWRIKDLTKVTNELQRLINDQTKVIKKEDDVDPSYWMIVPGKEYE